MSVTLLQKGKVIIRPDTPKHEQERIKELVAVDYIMEWFQARIPTQLGGTPLVTSRGPQDRILLIKAGTGSGKSVTIGPELYARYVGKGLGSGRSIGITQPRVLTATSKPHEIAEIPSMNFLRFGENLGYQTGLFINKPIKGVVFMTIGIVSHQITTMEPEEFMKKYSFIILDECHERSIPLDTAMFKLKQFVNTHWTNELCPFVVLMSATYNTDKYAKYFDIGPENVIDIMGQSKPIASRFQPFACSNLITGAVKKIIEIHEGNEHDYKSTYGRDIIVFCATNSKIKGIVGELDLYNSKRPAQYILPINLNSDTFKSQDEGYRNIYKPYDKITMMVGDKKVVPGRRVIIATPVAETGVTLPSLKYCIDTGFHMSPEFNPTYNCTVLAEKPVTQNMALQRKGRVGRKFPGEWYPLYTKEIYDAFIPDTYPSMVISSVDVFILSMMIEQCVVGEYPTSVIVEPGQLKPFDIRKVDLLDPVPLESMTLSLQKFYALGMIDSNYIPTIKTMCTIKMSGIGPELTTMILAGYNNGCNIELLTTISAFASSGGDKLFARKYTRREVFNGDDLTRKQFKTKMFVACDFIDYVFIYDEVQKLILDNINQGPYEKIEAWCYETGINFETLKGIFTQRDVIVESIIRIGLDPYANVPESAKYSLSAQLNNDFDGAVAQISKIKTCLLEGFIMNTAIYSDEQKSYISRFHGLPVNVQSDLIPTSGVMPRLLIYFSSTLRKKPYPGKPFKFSISNISIIDSFVKVHDTDYIVS